ncbi:hypothetical protein QCA50_020179 [Cerrena zonata]|uniref:Uncharacterized protein n=1 Tax=Cerrena zonata TaxID=2478898 RepID=A0AAW0F9F9_9APHY
MGSISIAKSQLSKARKELEHTLRVQKMWKKGDYVVYTHVSDMSYVFGNIDMRRAFREVGEAAVESFIRPEVYNIFDLHNFSFEKHVDTRCRTTEKEFNKELAWIHAIRDQIGSETYWKEQKFGAYGEEIEDYVLYCTAEFNEGQMTDDEDDTFIPSTISTVMQLICNASNNIAIIIHLLPAVAPNIDADRKREISVLGWFFHQVIDFCIYACKAAWNHQLMTPQFVPFDLLEFLDIFKRVGSWKSSLFTRLGYNNRYEVNWSPSLGAYIVTNSMLYADDRTVGVVTLDENHDIVKMMLDQPLFKCPFDVDNATTWMYHIQHSTNDLRVMYTTISTHMDMVDALLSCPETDEAFVVRREQVDVDPKKAHASREDLIAEFVDTRILEDPRYIDYQTTIDRRYAVLEEKKKKLIAIGGKVPVYKAALNRYSSTEEDEQDVEAHLSPDSDIERAHTKRKRNTKLKRKAGARRGETNAKTDRSLKRACNGRDNERANGQEAGREMVGNGEDPDLPVAGSSVPVVSSGDRQLLNDMGLDNVDI